MNDILDKQPPKAGCVVKSMIIDLYAPFGMATQANTKGH